MNLSCRLCYTTYFETIYFRQLPGQTPQPQVAYADLRLFCDFSLMLNKDYDSCYCYNYSIGSYFQDKAIFFSSSTAQRF